MTPLFVLKEEGDGRGLVIQFTVSFDIDRFNIIYNP